MNNIDGLTDLVIEIYLICLFAYISYHLHTVYFVLHTVHFHLHTIHVYLNTIA